MRGLSHVAVVGTAGNPAPPRQGREKASTTRRPRWNRSARRAGRCARRRCLVRRMDRFALTSMVAAGAARRRSRPRTYAGRGPACSRRRSRRPPRHGGQFPGISARSSCPAACRSASWPSLRRDTLRFVGRRTHGDAKTVDHPGGGGRAGGDCRAGRRIGLMRGSVRRSTHVALPRPPPPAPARRARGQQRAIRPRCHGSNSLGAASSRSRGVGIQAVTMRRRCG